jgi:hypothetical protein
MDQVMDGLGLIEANVKWLNNVPVLSVSVFVV